MCIQVLNCFVVLPVHSLGANFIVPLLYNPYTNADAYTCSLKGIYKGNENKLRKTRLENTYFIFLLHMTG